ncbi:MAG: type II toxin-antitoxin system death-on-curing family toxin [Candidatus Heimdallarchaeota archaeon]|nr:type II toxin-antitoxin system death-on-curing family toxin [Candidatus Heimdallarchaeota archaeon]
MEYPTFDQIQKLHNKYLKLYGGESGILNIDGLRSFTVSIPQHVKFGDKDIIQTAAYLMMRLIQNHYFVDGNKRIGLGVMLTFLKLNNCTTRNIINWYELTIKVASSELTDLEDLEEILKRVIVC